MHNVSDQPGRLNWLVRHTIKTQYFLQTMWGLQGETNGLNGSPNPLQMAVLLREYRDEFRLSSPA